MPSPSGGCTSNEYVNEKDIFTIKYLRNYGFTSELDDYGFEDCVYESLIYSTGLYSFSPHGENRLISRKEVSCGTPSFMRMLLNKNDKLKLNKFFEILNKEYGINRSIEDNHIYLEKIKDTEIYYDKTLEIYYKDYNTFIGDL